MKSGYAYIVGSLTGVLYTGVTSKLELRIFQHKNGIFEGFSKTYNCTRLLYFERYDDIRKAIAREKRLKGWRREKKLNLIRTTNPDFKRPCRALGFEADYQA
jgi:putative endonuclease